MTTIHREASSFRPCDPASGWIMTARALNIRAQKAVIIGTGGSSGKSIPHMLDPRLTEEYCGLAGMPWSDQDASGELVAMAIGASLWGLTISAGEFGYRITKPGSIGCQYGYPNLRGSGQHRVRQGARHRPEGGRLAGRHHREHVGQALLRRDRPRGSRPTLSAASIDLTIPAVIATPQRSDTIPVTSSTPRSPALATGKTAAGRSGRFSTPTPPRARCGI